LCDSNPHGGESGEAATESLIGYNHGHERLDSTPAGRLAANVAFQTHTECKQFHKNR
jgi:hypothetical protein